MFVSALVLSFSLSLSPTQNSTFVSQSQTLTRFGGIFSERQNENFLRFQPNALGFFRHSARLTQSKLMWAQFDRGNAQSKVSTRDEWLATRQQLLERYDFLEDNYPGLGAPIWLMVGGSIVSAIDLLFLAVGLAFGAVFTVEIIAMMIGAGVLAAGLITFGIIVLGHRVRERADFDKEMHTIQERLREMQLMGPPGIETPPAKTVPPPQVGIHPPGIILFAYAF